MPVLTVLQIKSHVSTNYCDQGPMQSQLEYTAFHINKTKFCKIYSQGAKCSGFVTEKYHILLLKSPVHCLEVTADSLPSSDHLLQMNNQEPHNA